MSRPLRIQYAGAWYHPEFHKCVFRALLFRPLLGDLGNRMDEGNPLQALTICDLPARLEKFGIM